MKEIKDRILMWITNDFIINSYHDFIQKHPYNEFI